MVIVMVVVMMNVVMIDWYMSVSFLSYMWVVIRIVVG